MSFASAWYDPNAARGSSERQFRYANASGTYTAVGHLYNPATGRFEYMSRPIPLGAYVAPDWARTIEGFHSFNRPTDTQYMRPIHIPYPTQSPGGNYKVVTRIPILVQGIEELLMWTCSGSIAPREMKILHAIFAACPEAAAGKLRVYVLRASRQFTSTVLDQQTGTMVAKAQTAPIWEPLDGDSGWIDRTEEIFGRREVPLLNLQVGAASAAPVLSQDTSTREMPSQTAPNGGTNGQSTEIPIERPKADPFKNIAPRSAEKKSPPF
jgi:hypothetical protein